MKPLKKAAAYFFSAYLVLQWAGFAYAPKGEFFPVFSWSLFSVVKNDVRDIVVEVTKVGDREYSPAVNYYQLDEVFPAAKKRDSGLLKAARRLASTSPNSPAYEERENEFMASFFDIEQEVAFQLAVIRFDPLERWHSGNLVDRRLISTHSTLE